MAADARERLLPSDLFSDPTHRKEVEDQEAHIVKVLGGGDSRGTGTKQLPKDHFAREVQAGNVIPPLYDPMVWAYLLEQHTRYRRLVTSMATNTVGLGFEIIPKRDDEKFFEENREAIRREQEEFTELFDGINPEMPFSELMTQVKIDEESTGQGHLEVERSRVGDRVVHLWHVPSHTVRVGKPRGNLLKYVQMRMADQSKKVYFKPFGVTEGLDATTGKWEDEAEVADPANEIITFKLYTPRSSYYGIPRIVSAAPAIAGSRLAQLRNVAFFENDACQPLYSKVLTPDGWVTMGDLVVGSQVIGSDGKAHDVIGVYPQSQAKPVYRVYFRDGGFTDCTDDHVWCVTNSYDRKRGVRRLMTLQQILDDGVRYDCGIAKWAVPLVDPVEYELKGDLPVDPYALGYLLGNGCLGESEVTVSVNSHDADALLEELLPTVPDGMGLGRRDREGQEPWHEGWVELRYLANGGTHVLRDQLRDLGLLGCTSGTKFIPECYLRASVEERFALLQGLLDSDGHVGGTAVRYVTVSERLAAGVRDLVEGLGGTVSIKPQTGRNTLQLTIAQLPARMQERLCRLPRKAKKCRTLESPRWRTIVDVEYLRHMHTQCIKVDAEDSLYVTDNHIVTHNTPRVAIIVNGGTLDETSMKMIEDFVEARGKGPGNAGRLMLLQGQVANKLLGSESGLDIKIMPLTVGVQDDASFTQYLNQNNEEIREAFGIGQIFIGTSDDVNRAVALAMKQLTVEQIFEPESRRYEYRINQCVMRTNGAQFTKFRFRRPKTVDMVAESQAYSMLAAAGGVTPNQIQEFLGKPKFNGAWADTPLPVLKAGLLEDDSTETQTLKGKYGTEALVSPDTEWQVQQQREAQAEAMAAAAQRGERPHLALPMYEAVYGKQAAEVLDRVQTIAQGLERMGFNVEITPPTLVEA